MVFFSLLVILLIVLIAGAWFLTPERVDENSPALLRGLAQLRQLSEHEAQDTTTTTIYKWRDAQGEWHFSNTPPPAGAAVEVKTYRSDSNIIPAPRAPTPRPTEKSITGPSADSRLPIPGLPDPTTVKKALDDARNVQQLHENRQRDIDRQVDVAQ